MSDNQFSDQEIEQILAWLEKRDPVCDCGGTDFDLERNRPGLILPESIVGLESLQFIPLVLLTCMDCSRIRLYSAAIMLKGSEDG